MVGALLAAVLLSLPFVLNQFQNSVMSIVFIFVMMGLGLNIVVGYAGLLDLGYVAFFAIGAYVYAFVAAPFSSPYISALLTGMGISPASPLLGYWSAIPLAMITAAIGGVLLGIPVLRLRGDYLAIVTLGFGEIIRLFMLNLGDLTNGPRGLLQIAQPTLFGVAPASLTTHLDAQGWIFLLAIFGSALVAFVAIRLNDSRLGRAWVAMREDEDVAQATGIHLVQTKLLAFAIGATFAGLAGQLYAARQINIFPENFSLFVSIDALALIIVGGMGSIPGVVLGALALKGLPEVLRGVDEYRIVTFAALLIVMMIVRPEGILPSARRRRELHSEEVARPARTERNEGKKLEGGQPDGCTAGSEGCYKVFGGLTAVDQVDLAIEKGSIASLIGPNGAGKTTFFNCMTGSLPTGKGVDHLFNGHSLVGQRSDQIIGLGIARTYQNIRLSGDDCAGKCAGGPARAYEGHASGRGSAHRSQRAEERKAEKKARELLDFVGLGGKGDRSPKSALRGPAAAGDRPGHWQRPQLLLLDEPAAGMNPRRPTHDGSGPSAAGRRGSPSC